MNLKATTPLSTGHPRCASMKHNQLQSPRSTGLAHLLHEFCGCTWHLCRWKLNAPKLRSNFACDCPSVSIQPQV